MNILIPVDDSEIEDAQITLLDNVKYWILIEFVEGKIKKTDVYQTRNEISDWVDVVVLKTDKEDLWQFMESNIAVLIAPMQRSVEDIMEAYLFKELHDANVQY